MAGFSQRWTVPAPDSTMRRAAFGFVLTLSALLPASVFAGGLPSAFDPTVFTVALCDFRPDPNAFDFRGPPCYGTFLDQGPASVDPDGYAREWYYLINNTDPDHEIFVHSIAFKTHPHAPSTLDSGILEQGLHRYAAGGDAWGVPEGWVLYLETKRTKNEYVYGLFARTPRAADFASTHTTVTPEPATWVLLGTGIAGLGAWRRRIKRKD